MASWIIAKDMARINEENLSKLSRKSMYARLKEMSSKAKGKKYTFKKATPEILKAIRQKRITENQIAKKKRIIIGLSCISFGIILFWITMTF